MISKRAIVIDLIQLCRLKKTGFGAGVYNGFGGKVEMNESILEAAKRECKEEACIDLVNCEKIGIIFFSFTYLDELFEVHVFTSNEWNGIPKETKEMRPEWFSFDQVPYEKMWKDDILWLPYLLCERPHYFVGAASFDEDGAMLSHCFKSIQDKKEQIDYLMTGKSDKLSLDYSVLFDTLN